MPRPTVFRHQVKGPPAATRVSGIIEGRHQIMGADRAHLRVGQERQGAIEGLSGKVQDQMADAAALVIRHHIERGLTGAAPKQQQEHPKAPTA
jgi:hypothetical protein